MHYKYGKRIILGAFSVKTVIPLVLAGCEMIIAKSWLSIMSHATRARGKDYQKCHKL